MINQLDEAKLSKSVKRTVKVRSFSGADVNQMYQNIEPFLKNIPDVIIIHVGTKDAVRNTSDTIIDDLLKFKHFIELALPEVKVIFSCPIIRTDNARANVTIRNFIHKMKDMKVHSLLNTNISLE